jgi:Raf kinase inhibitor-like YbhB/YbcL family protein
MIIGTCFSVRPRVPAAVALILATVSSGAAAAFGAEHLSVTSPAFSGGATIPNVAAYRGCASGAENRSPELAWRGAPAGTKSFAVTLFDPDAPTGHGFWHWVMFDIPPDVHRVADGAGDPHAAAAVRGAVFGRTDFGTSAYGGPCPPPGNKPHHYVFTVRALDIAVVPGAKAATTGPELLGAVAGHVLAEGTLIGRFGR